MLTFKNITSNDYITRHRQHLLNASFVDTLTKSYHPIIRFYCRWPHVVFGD